MEFKSKNNIEESKSEQSDQNKKPNNNHISQNILEDSNNINYNSTEEKKITKQNQININNIENEEEHIKDIEKIIKILIANVLFKNIDLSIIKELAKRFEVFKFKTDEIVYQENDSGSLFYVISSGQFEISKSKEPNTKSIKGDSETFGELVLIKKSKRTETVKCIESGIVYALHRKHYMSKVSGANKKMLLERLEFLKNVPIFGFFDAGVLSTITMTMSTVAYSKGETIFKQGDHGDSMYIISEGEIECRNDTGFKRILKAKDFFGELAILFDFPRTATVYTKSIVNCFIISQNDLIQNLGKDYKNLFFKSILKNAFKSNKKYGVLANDEYLTGLSEHWDIVNMDDKQLLVKQGEPNKDDLKIYIMLAGNLIEMPNNKTITKRFELFDKFLDTQTSLNQDIYTQGDAILLSIKWDDIIKTINPSYRDKSFDKSYEFFAQLNYMKQVELFKNSTNKLLINMCNRMITENFKQGEVIFSEGDIGDKFYLIKKGNVGLHVNNILKKTIQEGSFFGERALLSDPKRTGTIIAMDNVICYVLKKQDFDATIDDNMRNYFNHRISLQDNFKFKLDDFYYIKDLGKGKFGNVSLVHNKKYFYAIKSLSRKAAEKQKILIKYFLEEKRVLSKVDHPFIMRLVGTLKNDLNIFYLTEFIDGITLSKRLEERNKQLRTNRVYPKKTEIQFYLSFLFIILDYLNSRNITHRDLKPDNIMVGVNGYLKLIDFGTAIQIKNFTSTITGTPHYISPEVLLGNGYSYSCDYWSVGVIAYEMYYGCYPFGNDANEPIDVYKEVLRKDLCLPTYGNESSLNDLIRSLLRKKVSQRLCNLESAKNHPFFINFNWDDLLDFKLPAPYKPKETQNLNYDSKLRYINYLIKCSKKRFNFDNDSDEDELLSDYEEDDSRKYNPNWADEF